QLVEAPAFVTKVFELGGPPSPVSVETSANVNNQWLGLNYALVNDETGQAFEFDREVSYYAGVEDGESWSEGSQSDTAVLPSIPSGRYFLRVEPESERGTRDIVYAVKVTRDVPTMIWLLLALPLLLLPPLLMSFRWWRFERLRWQESDHG